MLTSLNCGLFVTQESAVSTADVAVVTTRLSRKTSHVSWQCTWASTVYVSENVIMTHCLCLD